jgi:hypothetical protein
MDQDASGKTRLKTPVDRSAFVRHAMHYNLTVTYTFSYEASCYEELRGRTIYQIRYPGPNVVIFG